MLPCRSMATHRVEVRQTRGASRGLVAAPWMTRSGMIIMVAFVRIVGDDAYETVRAYGGGICVFLVFAAAEPRFGPAFSVRGVAQVVELGRQREQRCPCVR